MIKFNKSCDLVVVYGFDDQYLPDSPYGGMPRSFKIGEIVEADIVNEYNVNGKVFYNIQFTDGGFIYKIEQSLITIIK